MYELKQQALILRRLAPIGREGGHPESPEKKADPEDVDKHPSEAPPSDASSEENFSEEDTQMFAERLVRSLMRPKTSPPPQLQDETTQERLERAAAEAKGNKSSAEAKGSASSAEAKDSEPPAKRDLAEWRAVGPESATVDISSFLASLKSGKPISSGNVPVVSMYATLPEKEDGGDDKEHSDHKETSSHKEASSHKEESSHKEDQSSSLREENTRLSHPEPSLALQEKSAEIEVFDVLASDVPDIAVWDDDAPETMLLETLPATDPTQYPVEQAPVQSEMPQASAYSETAQAPVQSETTQEPAQSKKAYGDMDVIVLPPKVGGTGPTAQETAGSWEAQEAENTAEAQESASPTYPEMDVVKTDDRSAPPVPHPASAPAVASSAPAVSSSAPAVSSSAPAVASSAPAVVSAASAVASGERSEGVLAQQAAVGLPNVVSPQPPAKKKRAIVLADRYALLEKIGEGATGEVFRVHDMEVGDIIALKLLSVSHSRKRDSLERFRREVRLARRVTHRHIARIFDMGKLGDRYYLTMELIQGRSLDALITADERPDFLRICGLLRSICEGLQAAHEAGVIHRDLKPDNILLEHNGRVVITDFGIARQTKGEEVFKTLDGSVMGTPAYMAPEQIKAGGAVDQRADIFALGVILYEMITGVPVAKGSNLMEVLMARLQSPPPDPRALRPETPEILADLTRDCMALDPEARPHDMGVMLVRLAHVREALEQEDAAPRPTARLKGFAEGVMSLLGSKKNER